MNFSPDGLWLATGVDGRDPRLTGEVTLWDPRTGEKVWDTGRHEGDVYTVGFGRDSRTLISGGEEGCCYVWDLGNMNDRSSNPETDWTDLQHDDSKTVFQALQRLTNTPDRTVKLLEAKLKDGRFASLESERMAHQ